MQTEQQRAEPQGPAQVDQRVVVDYLNEFAIANTKRATVAGFMLVILGILAMISPVISGMAASSLLAVFMMAGGLTIAAYCFKSERFGKGLVQFLLGGFTFAAGVLMYLTPMISMFTITGILLIYFIVDGVYSAYTAFKMRPERGWGWLLFSGISSVGLGGLIAYQLPNAAFFTVGILVGVRLLISGWTIVMLGMASSNIQEQLYHSVQRDLETAQTEEKVIPAQ